MSWARSVILGRIYTGQYLAIEPVPQNNRLLYEYAYPLQPHTFPGRAQPAKYLKLYPIL